MGKKNKKSKFAAVETGPILRWMVCQDGDVHVVGPCPRCFESTGGWLMGTSGTVSEGITRAQCSDCDEIVDYYVDPETEQVWKAQAIPEPVDAACAS